jgi:hypothetical protein
MAGWRGSSENTAFFTNVPKMQTLIPLKSHKTEVFKTRVAPKCSSAVTGAGYSTGTVWTVTAAGNFTISIAS